MGRGKDEGRGRDDWEECGGKNERTIRVGVFGRILEEL